MLKIAIIRVNDDDPDDVTILESWRFSEKMVEHAPLFRKWLVRKSFAKVEYAIKQHSIHV